MAIEFSTLGYFTIHTYPESAVHTDCDHILQILSVVLLSQFCFWRLKSADFIQPIFPSFSKNHNFLHTLKGKESFFNDNIAERHMNGLMCC